MEKTKDGNGLYEDKTGNMYIRVIPCALHSLGDILDKLKHGYRVRYSKKQNRFFLEEKNEG